MSMVAPSRGAPRLLRVRGCRAHAIRETLRGSQSREIRLTSLPMQGVRVLEVAQFTFTPAAGAVLADWGAEVIKVEHAVAGDAQRGLSYGPVGWSEGRFHPIMEHPNRGKRSIGLALEHPAGREVLLELARQSDVFLTNFLPDARARLRIDVADLRAANPTIIYARGSAYGARGPDARKGGFDANAYWARSGASYTVTPRAWPDALGMPGPAYGDSLGGMTIAGAIAAALFARDRSGEPSVLDVSLLSVGAWGMALPIDLSLANGKPWEPASLGGGGQPPPNPVVGSFRTADGRHLYLSALQPKRHWADICRHLGREDWISDPRCATDASMLAHAAEIAELVAAEIERHTLAEWCERFRTLEAQWSPSQNTLELAHDAQLRANGYIAEIADADGNRRELLANPAQFDETPAQLRRAPQFAEHTDEILRELGHSEEQILDLKIAGAVT
jgi:crotonobetainyl-CoA:carnitine CoA-transferase CaiB-like acyl-CoA transferase